MQARSSTDSSGALVRPLSVAIAAGGTGGHIYPGLALAAALRRRVPGVHVHFVGTHRGLETRVVPGAGYPLGLVDMLPFSGGLRRALVPAAMVRSTIQARLLLMRECTNVAVGMGGYSSLPVIVAARIAGIPSLIHESGAIPGKANLVAARFARSVAVAFREARPRFAGAAEVRYVGMPINEEISRFDRASIRAPARASFDLPDGVKVLLVTGGSQGARRLNEVAVALARRWRGRDDVRILIKAGGAHAETVARALAAGGGDRVARAVAYFDRMDHAYGAADMVLCRAGAATVAELAVTGLPSILVPYPFATSDHQTINARSLVEAGGAALVADHEVTEERIATLVEGWLSDPRRLEAMSAAARSEARPQAADELAEWVVEKANAAASLLDAGSGASS